MSEFKIKVGLELDDDIKELIHSEIIRQLKEDSNFSVVAYGDNFTWSVIHEDDKTSKVIYSPNKLVFTKDDEGGYVFKKDKNDINELKQEINELKCKVDKLIK